MTVTYHRPEPPPGLLSRQPDEQPRPRLDGSVHAEQICYECGASSFDVLMDPVIRSNHGEAEYRFACHDLTDCRWRKATVQA